MPSVSFGAASPDTSRAIVKGLFAASCILSVVSWYTTQQGMALYLSSWFAFLASFGIQTALVLTAWLIGLSHSRRKLMISVYAITAAVSIAFSYVSLFTWFSAKERPAVIERKLYDALGQAGGKIEALLVSAVNEASKHTLALEEMTASEKANGYISRAPDPDPYLARVREAVAKEGAAYKEGYKEGAGGGVRYTAFDRHSRIAQQAQAKLQESQRAWSTWRSQRRPQDPSEKQLRDFDTLHASVPWTDMEQAIHAGAIEKPAAPSYSDFVDQTSSGQEDLLVAFEELGANPVGKPGFALALAAFIDIVIFLLAYAAGPHLAGAEEQRWIRAAAAVDAVDSQILLRNLLRKIEADANGCAHVEDAALTAGERQLCLALSSRGEATIVTYSGRKYFALEEQVHQMLLDAISSPSLHLRAAERIAAAN